MRETTRFSGTTTGCSGPVWIQRIGSHCRCWRSRDGDIDLRHREWQSMVAIRTDRTGAGGIAIAAPLLVILGAAAAAGLYAEAPRLLMLAIGAILAPFALVIAYRYPGAVFAAYLCTPFYKAGLQPYVPVDVTILLSVLCFLQLPFMFMAGTGSASVAGRSVRWRNALV